MLEQLQKEKQLFESYLEQSTQNITHDRLKQSMSYSLSNGGKRVRPLLIFETLRLFQENIRMVYPIAAAIEYIHTYSLIHDDLPAMDNDDYRRGQLTNHKQFDETTAILAGDALLTHAFGLIGESELSAEQKVTLMNALVQFSGGNGMIGGQMYDMFGQGKEIDLIHVKYTHELKTAALLRFCVKAACVVANVGEEVMSKLDQFAVHFGLAFQIHNDIKDVLQDEVLEKSTYVKLLGKEGAIQALENEMNCAKLMLLEIEQNNTTIKATQLEQFLNFLN